MAIVWLVILVSAVASVILAAMIMAKFNKFERMHTAEAQTNLELINQSLNRLSAITEKLEKLIAPNERETPIVSRPSPEVEPAKQHQRAITMLRQGEDPKTIARRLGLSRAEMTLLAAAHKASNGAPGQHEIGGETR